VKQSLLLLLTSPTLFLCGCGQSNAAVAPDAEVVAYTPRGGIVKFSGNLVYTPLAKAHHLCSAQGESAVPLGFYTTAPDDQKRDQLMTFECK
jgi:hypothetical protein